MATTTIVGYLKKTRLAANCMPNCMPFCLTKSTFLFRKLDLCVWGRVLKTFKTIFFKMNLYSDGGSYPKLNTKTLYFFQTFLSKIFHTFLCPKPQVEFSKQKS